MDPTVAVQLHPPQHILKRGFPHEASQLTFSLPLVRMKPTTSTLALGLLSGSALVSGFRIPVQRRAGKTHKATMAGLSSTPYNSAPLANVGTGASNDSEIANSNNMFYSTNITIAGVGMYLSIGFVHSSFSSFCRGPSSTRYGFD